VRARLLLLTCAVLGCGDKRPAPAEPPDDAARAAAPAPDDAAAGGRFRVHDSLADALAEILALEPRVIGVGELHQTHQTAGVSSTLARFAGEALPVLAPRASDLLVETWVREGRCGETEARVNRDVTADTQRPAATETELGALARRARELAIEPHALTMSCEDYAAVQDRDGGVDYERFLELIGARLKMRSLELDARADGERGAVVVYGGAIHNDLYPDEALASWSYGPAVSKAVGDRYVELDLLVPEMIDAREASVDEDWYPVYRDHAPERGVLLIERRPRSFVIVLPRGVAAR
jgi:hypothetical protein